MNPTKCNAAKLDTYVYIYTWVLFSRSISVVICASLVWVFIPRDEIWFPFLLVGKQADVVRVDPRQEFWRQSGQW